MISLTYLYSKFFKKILRGRCVINSQIHPTSHVDSATEFHNSTMDKYSYVGYDSQVYNAQIGPFCSIGDFFLCGGATHPMDWLSTSSTFYGGGNVGNSKKLAEYKIPPTEKNYYRRGCVGRRTRYCGSWSKNWSRCSNRHRFGSYSRCSSLCNRCRCSC